MGYQATLRECKLKLLQINPQNAMPTFHISGTGVRVVSASQSPGAGVLTWWPAEWQFLSDYVCIKSLTDVYICLGNNSLLEIHPKMV